MWSGFLRHVSPEGFEKRELRGQAVDRTPSGLLGLGGMVPSPGHRLRTQLRGSERMRPGRALLPSRGAAHAAAEASCGQLTGGQAAPDAAGTSENVCGETEEDDPP